MVLLDKKEIIWVTVQIFLKITVNISLPVGQIGDATSFRLMLVMQTFLV